jgi:hypothetical protein
MRMRIAIDERLHAMLRNEIVRHNVTLGYITWLYCERPTVSSEQDLGNVGSCLVPIMPNSLKSGLDPVHCTWKAGKLIKWYTEYGFRQQ